MDTAMIPTARFVKIGSRGRVVVECPYCGERHEHERFRIGHLEHRAAGCSLYMNQDRRLIGYTFTVPERIH